MRSGYLLDTNHVGLAVSPGSDARARLRRLRRAGLKVGTTMPVLCELEAGMRYVRDPSGYRDNLRRLLSEVRMWPLDLTTARIYGRVFDDLRRRGRVLSQVDLMLASLAEQMNLVLVSTDKDFDALPHIAREDGTKP